MEGKPARSSKELENRSTAPFATAESMPSEHVNGSEQSAADKAEFQKFVARSTLDVQWPSSSFDYKTAEQDWKLRDYESLS